VDDRIADVLLDILPEPPIQKQSRRVQDRVLPSSALGLPADRLVRLLCGHDPVPVSKREISQLLFPDFDLDTVKLVLPRAGYSTVEEREAEILASLMLERVAVGSPTHPHISKEGRKRRGATSARGVPSGRQR